LIDHVHNFRGTAGGSYYAINDLNSTPSDRGAVLAEGPEARGDAQYSPYTGQVDLTAPGTDPTTLYKRNPSSKRSFITMY